MTAITTSQRSAWLQTGILTLEQAVLRDLLIMYRLYGNLVFSANVNDRQASRITLNTGEAFDGKTYSLFTAAFEVDSVILTTNPNNKKPWEAAIEWGNLAVPDAFFQNSPT